jgi:hypothetical protein
MWRSAMIVILRQGTSATARTLLGALQLFGLLIATDAGRRCGLDAALQGVAVAALWRAAGHR